MPRRATTALRAFARTQKARRRACHVCPANSGMNQQCYPASPVRLGESARPQRPKTAHGVMMGRRRLPQEMPSAQRAALACTASILACAPNVGETQ